MTNLEREIADKATYEGNEAVYLANVRAARTRDAEISDRQLARQLVGPEGVAFRAAQAKADAAYADWCLVRDRVGAFHPEAEAAWKLVEAARDVKQAAMLAALRVVEMA